MGTIVLGGPQNITLDGMVQDPDGREGSERGGWFAAFGGDDLVAWNEVALADALSAEVWLLGRTSYEFFGSRWQARTGELADRINGLPKYVVSASLGEAGWRNSTVLRGDVVTEVARLREEVDGEIVVPAGHRLGRTLLRHGLVDEIRLVVFPVVLGAGERLFDGTGSTRPMRLVRSRTVGAGLVHLVYRAGPVGPGAPPP